MFYSKIIIIQIFNLNSNNVINIIKLTAFILCNFYLFINNTTNNNITIIKNIMNCNCLY